MSSDKKIAATSMKLRSQIKRNATSSGNVVPSKVRKVPSPPAKPTKLTDLNDYCLIAIFRKLPLEDLNTISRACHRFHDIAINNVYKYQPSLKHLDIAALTERNWSEGICMGYLVERIKGYLGRFGPFIERINFGNKHIFAIRNQTYTNDIFASITSHCTTTLKTLQMTKVNLDTRTMLRANGEEIFTNLTQLDIDDYTNRPKILPLCINLKELCLNINSERSSSPINLQYIFPKLNSFALTCRGGRGLLPENGLDSFLLNHLSLTRLSLKTLYCLNIVIIGQLKDLEELYLNIGDSVSAQQQNAYYSTFNHQPLFQLSKLRKLKVKRIHASVLSDFLKHSSSVQTLEHLTIEDYVIEGSIIDGLSRFHRLRYLSLSMDTATAPNMPNINRLEQLTELIELRLHLIHFTKRKQILKHLTGSQHSLQIVTISKPLWEQDIDNEFIATLSQFKNLQKLELELDLTAYLGDVSYNWQPLQHLAQLKQLILKNTRRMNDILSSTPRDLLNNLGSHHSLEKFDFNGKMIADEELFSAICKFTNLKELTLYSIENMSVKQLIAFKPLNQMRKFNITVKLLNTRLITRNNRIFDLVRNWPSLENFRFRQFDFGQYSYGNHRYSKNLCNKLVKLFKARRKSLRSTSFVSQDLIELSTPG